MIRRECAPFLKTADGRGIFAPRLRHNRVAAFCRPEENAMIRTANDLRTVKEEIRRYADRRVTPPTAARRRIRTQKWSAAAFR